MFFCSGWHEACSKLQLRPGPLRSITSIVAASDPGVPGQHAVQLSAGLGALCGHHGPRFASAAFLVTVHPRLGCSLLPWTVLPFQFTSRAYFGIREPRVQLLLFAG